MAKAPPFMPAKSAPPMKSAPKRPAKRAAKGKAC